MIRGGAQQTGGNGAPVLPVAPRGEAVDIDRVIAELRHIDRRTGIDRTLAIGELILNEFFGGNPAAWRDRRRNKNNSIRRLAGRDDCPFCRSALNEAVAVHVAVLEMPCVRTFGHIHASHVASVLPLPSGKRQAILENAERDQWSVRELRQEVVLARRAEGERRGGPASGAERRSLPALRGAVRALDEAVGQIEQIDRLGTLGDAVRGEIGTICGEIGRIESRLSPFARAPRKEPRAVSSGV